MYDEGFPEPEFKVYGDQRVLYNMVINIEAGVRSSPYIYLKNQTLLYKEGKQYVIQNEFVHFYRIYFSYENKVGSLAFENIYANTDGDRVNSIYVVKTDDGVRIEYYPMADAQRSGRLVSETAKFVDDYFKEHHIPKEKQTDTFKKFYSFYDAAQNYQRQPLSDSFIQDFKCLPFSLKEQYEIFPEDLEKLDLPKDEKIKLIEHAKTLNLKDRYSLY